MTIPPEILEQIEKEAKKVLVFQDIINLGKLGYSLCQKQTPPPTSINWQEVWLDHKEFAIFPLDEKLIEFNVNEQLKNKRSDRDQKIAQAVEGLVEAIKKYETAFKTIKAQMTLRPGMMGVWDRQMEVILEDSPRALSKWEEAKNEKHLR